MNTKSELGSDYTQGYKQIDPNLLDTSLAVYEVDENVIHSSPHQCKLGAYTTSLLETSGQLLDVTM